MPSLEEVGQRIRLARTELHLTQAALGRLLDPPRSYAAVSELERGKTRLSIDELSKIAELLRKPLAYFTEGQLVENVPTAIDYRRNDLNQSPDRRRESDLAVDAFKQFARQQARKRREELEQ